MNVYLEEFFKSTPLSINSVMQAAVVLAEKVNSRTELSGKEKSELVVKTLSTFLGEGQPEMVALVNGVVPGMLGIVVSAARGKVALRHIEAAKAWCVPSNSPATTATTATTATEVKSSDPTVEVSAELKKVITPSMWAWGYFCSKASSDKVAVDPPAAAPAAAPAAVEPAPAEKLTVREASA